MFQVLENRRMKKSLDLGEHKMEALEK